MNKIKRENENGQTKEITIGYRKITDGKIRKLNVKNKGKTINTKSKSDK